MLLTATLTTNPSPSAEIPSLQWKGQRVHRLVAREGQRVHLVAREGPPPKEMTTLTTAPAKERTDGHGNRNLTYRIRGTSTSTSSSIIPKYNKFECLYAFFGWCLDNLQLVRFMRPPWLLLAIKPQHVPTIVGSTICPFFAFGSDNCHGLPGSSKNNKKKTTRKTTQPF